MAHSNPDRGYYVVSQTQGGERTVVYAESRTAAAHALGDVTAWVLAGPYPSKREANGRGTKRVTRDA